MIKKNIYSRITESIVKAHHDSNLDTAMDDGHEMENMGKKIVAIITADPDSDLDWESEYEPFGAAELSDDEHECCDNEGEEYDHELCPSCGYDVDCDDDECEDDENDDVEDIMIGSGFESEDEADEYEDMDVKDILIDILDELRGEDDDEEDAVEEISDDEDSDEEMEDDSDDDDEDADEILSPKEDWSSEDDSNDEEYDAEQDFQIPLLRAALPHAAGAIADLIGDDQDNQEEIDEIEALNCPDTI